MAAEREIVYSLQFDATSTLSALDQFQSKLATIADNAVDAQSGAEGIGGVLEQTAAIGESAVNTVGSALAEMGDAGQAASGAVADALGGVGEAAQDVGINASQLAEIFNSLGDEAEESINETAQSTNKLQAALGKVGSAAKSAIGSVFNSAMDNVNKKITAFQKSITDVGIKIKNAFQHPIQTIKGAFTPSMQDAQKETDELGKRGDESSNILDRMGQIGSNAGNAISGAMKRAAALFLGFKGVKTVIDSVRSLFGEGVALIEEAETIDAKFKLLSDNTTTNVDAFVQNYAEATGKPITELKDLVLGNTDFFTKLGLSKNDAAGLATELTTIGNNIVTAFHVSDSEAQTAVQAYVAGDKNALEQYGISLSDSKRDQEAARLGFGTTYKKLTQSQQAIVNASLLIVEAEKLSGDAVERMSRASETLSEAKDKFNNAMTGLKRSVGTELRPALMLYYDEMSTAVKKVEPEITGLAESAASALAAITPGVTGVLTSFVTSFAPTASAIIETLAPSLKGALTNISADFIPALGDLAETGVGLLAPLMPTIDDVGGLAMEGITSLTSGLSEVLKTFQPLLNNARSILSPVRIVFTEITREGGIVDKTVKAITEIANNVMPPITALMEKISVALEGPLQTVFNTIGGAIERIAGPIGLALGNLATALGVVVDALAPFLQPIVDLAAALFDFAIDTLIVLINKFSDGLVDFVGYVKDPIGYGRAKASNEAEAMYNEQLRQQGYSEDEIEGIKAFNDALNRITKEAYLERNPLAETNAWGDFINKAAYEEFAANNRFAFGNQATQETGWTGEGIKLDDLMGGALAFTRSDAQADEADKVNESYEDVAEATEANTDALAESVGLTQEEHKLLQENTDSLNALQEELAAFTIGGLVWGNDPNTPIPGLTPGQKFDGNASGTANFAGGWTRINEEGGELAYLPQGTAIVPADKTNRILGDGSGGDNSVNATVNITIEGSADQNTISRIRDELTAFFDEMWRKKQSQQTNTRALWQAAV